MLNENIFDLSKSQLNQSKLTTSVLRSSLLLNKWDLYLSESDLIKMREKLRKGWRPSEPKKMSPDIISGLFRLNEFEITDIDIIDDLVKIGIPLPKLMIEEGFYYGREDYFYHLLQDVIQLYVTLKSNPDLLKMKNEKGETLLDQLCLYDFESPLVAECIFHVILRTETADVTVMTPSTDNVILRLSKCCTDPFIRNKIFPLVTKNAIEKGFDFGTHDSAGRAVMHNLCLYQTAIEELDRCPELFEVDEGYLMVEDADPSALGRFFQFLGKTKIDPNMLSRSGATPLFFALSNLSLKNAARLLVHPDINPALFGSPDRNPLMEIAEQIEKFEYEASKRNTELTEAKERLEAITAKMAKVNDRFQYREISYPKNKLAKTVSDKQKELEICEKYLEKLKDIEAILNQKCPNNLQKKMRGPR